MFGKKSKMSDLEKKAKLSALKGANSMANDALKGQLSGLKKVTVAADSKHGLEKGLQKAEELLGHGEMESEEPCPECEGMGCPACEESMGEHGLESEPDESDPLEGEESLDEEDIDAKIAHLLELKKKLQAGEE